MKKRTRLSRPGKPRRVNEGATKISAKKKAELKALEAKSDDQIDLSDIPEILDWSKAVVGKFYRPVKKSISMRVDSDVLAWFQSQGPKYQTKMNDVLREYMMRTVRGDERGRT